MPRLKELEQAEVSFLIFNGWNRRRVRNVYFWSHEQVCPANNGYMLNQDDAVRWQKSRDRGTDNPIMEIPRPLSAVEREAVTERPPGEEP